MAFIPSTEDQWVFCQKMYKKAFNNELLTKKADKSWKVLVCFFNHFSIIKNSAKKRISLKTDKTETVNV